ncbi:MAG: uridine kinase [Candidatus Eisenbacteria bacterium]|nr:uridine kinase [Candidatus Eisenbacteria bacterium]
MSRGILIGIAGGSGSGKTLVADTIDKELGSDKVTIIKQDSYYKDLSHLPYEERSKQNFDHPDAFDMLLLRDHLERLLRGDEIERPIYDFTQHRRSLQKEKMGPHLVIVLEGILILDDSELRRMMDIKVFIDTDPDVRLIRRLRRDLNERGRKIESIIDQYEKSVRPMHLQFVEPSKRYADIIITEGGHNIVAIDLLKTKIRSLL